MIHIGIDLGGTKIEGVVLDKDARILQRRRIATEQEHGYEHIMQRIKSLYESLLQDYPEAEHTVGVGTPGAISHVTGRLKNSNTQCLNNRLSKAGLEDLLNHLVIIENDANCFALAEAVSGAAQGRRMVFGVIMGTGCGGGLVYNGQIISGLQNIAGEWGHTSLDPEGNPCYCGKKGCVETYISGGGLEKAFFEESGEKLSVQTILDRFRGGDAAAKKFMRRFFSNFGRGLANVINILDPDIVVLGGGLSNIDELYTEGITEVRANIFSDDFITPIVKNRLGDSAGVIGAALLGRQAEVTHGT